MIRNKHFKILLICIFIFIFFYQHSIAQIQIGQTIYGEAIYDNSGTSISMPDPNTIAIGADGNDGNGSGSGHVRVYSWNGTLWIKKGADINGEAAGDMSGEPVSMPDANTVGIGSQGNDGNGQWSGHARVFIWNGSAWIQKGTDIDGEAAGDLSGISISMPDSNTIGIGACYNGGNGFHAGHVRIYSWNGNSWLQKGIDIDGEAAGDNSGWSVSMSDSNTIAIGAPMNDGNGSNSGQARVYSWNGTTWLQKGSDIDGEAIDDGFGFSIFMPDENTIAVGSIGNDDNGLGSGHVRIYSWNGSSWIQKGLDIDGDSSGDASGWSISMADANTIAIGAPYRDGNGIERGQVRLFVWNGISWIQTGLDIVGSLDNDRIGVSVNMPDINTLSAGAPQNSGIIPSTGYARIYSVDSLTSVYTLTFDNEIKVFPNPTTENITIELNRPYSNVSINVKNILGQVLQRNIFINNETLNISIPYCCGTYFLEVKTDNSNSFYKIVKK